MTVLPEIDHIRIMKFRVVFLVILSAICSFSCERAERLADGYPTPPPEVTTPTKDLPNLEIRTDDRLQERIATIASKAKGNVGVAAVVLETGDGALLNSDQYFPMQSVYKLPIAMAVLHAVDDEKLALDEQIGISKDDFVGANQHSPIRDKNPNGTIMTVRDLIRSSISESDGTASDVLMRLAGGPAAVQKYIEAIGLRDIVIANTEKEFALDLQTQYANWITPVSAVEMLRDLQEGNGISEPNRELLLSFMIGSTHGAKRIKGSLPNGTVVAHKTGTGGTRNGVTSATNDIGIVTMPNGKHILIAVFVADSSADEKTRESVIAEIARAVWDRWAANTRSAIKEN